MTLPPGETVVIDVVNGATENRDHALALACVRHGEPHTYGRGLDRLPAELLARHEDALVRSVDAAELRRALAAAGVEVGLHRP